MTETAPPPRRKKTILVVEDEESIALLLRARLQSAGYEVGWVASGDVALSFARASPPDLILLDIMLPEMDGFHIARLLKFDRRFRHIPIVMLTARHSPRDVARGYEAGADVYVTKPFDAPTLLKVIQDRLMHPPKRSNQAPESREPVWIDGLHVTRTTKTIERPPTK